MDISIIISGNLTGFSRFYASSNANDLYNEAKFDFDYRNFLTFINAGEKAYAISFSTKVIAVSLITRILDSFRRPGILVVTALVPRYQLVSGTLNAQDKSAIYRLLNEINDKFYEKNFLNGMVNQNPAVLMQDYYSDILRNYALVSDRMQKTINTSIEVNSPNKRIGYVSASEEDMPKYLSSLMRKSYNGYHHVFFAEKAPQNIDEPAEEIVTYKVRISNDNRPIHGEVRLDDRIPIVSPQQGEMPIPNQNYTYRQVLNGEAGNEILATLENDTIVLTYRFQQEEKTIYFKFYDGANEVPIHIIRPIIVESDGSSYPLSTDSWTFRGKEIYGLKTIKSGNSEYIVDPNSSRIDLQRLREGTSYIVYVSKGWIWNFKPIDNRTRRPVTIPPVDIVLENKTTGECRNFSRVTGAISERMSGNESDWVMKITSDYYEPITTTPNGGGYPFKRKQQPQPDKGGISQHTDVQRYGTQTRTQGQSSSDQNLRLSGGANDTAKEQARIDAEKEKRLIQYGIYAIVAIICCIGGWWGYTKFNPSEESETKEGEVVAEENNILTTKKVTFIIKDKDNNRLSSSILNNLSVSLEPNNIAVDTDSKFVKKFEYSDKRSEDLSVKVTVRFEEIDVSESQKVDVKTTLDSVTLILNLKESDIAEYLKLPKQISQTKKNELNLKIAQIGNQLFRKKFEKKLKHVTIESVVDWTRLDSVDASMSTIEEVKAEAEQKNVPIPEKYQKRMEKLKTMIGSLRKGDRPTAREGELSDAQIKKIQEIWDKAGIENTHYQKYKSQFKNVSSLTEFANKIKKMNI